MIKGTTSNVANQDPVLPDTEHEEPMASVIFLLQMPASHHEETVDKTKLKAIFTK